MRNGVYVCAVLDRRQVSTASFGECPTELMQARLAVEGSMVLMACGLVTPDSPASVAQALEDMRQAIAADRSPLTAQRGPRISLSHRPYGR